ncbi:MAG: hypothetical protein K6A94_00015 [Bacteroidales bacterium]|nr:hypothetical protein [Bacteroidales bacterium]
MNPLQQRQMLWEERTRMDDFLKDELFSELHRVYGQIETLPWMFPMDELKIMNEVGYGLTWLCCYNEADIDHLVREVYADMGLQESAEVVFSLVHAVVSVVNRPPLEVNKVAVKRLEQLNRESRCGRMVDNFVRTTIRSGRLFGNRFDAPEHTKTEPIPNPELESVPAKSQFATRSFTLEEIVAFAKESLTKETSIPIQNMLYYLLVTDGTKEERDLVASIPKGIQESEIHNHYEKDSHCQVFNGKVEGQFK